MLFTVSWCVEAMAQLCKVKVTLQGHEIMWRGGGVAVFQTAVLYFCVNKLFEFRSGTKRLKFPFSISFQRGLSCRVLDLDRVIACPASPAALCGVLEQNIFIFLLSSGSTQEDPSRDN